MLGVGARLLTDPPFAETIAAALDPVDLDASSAHSAARICRIARGAHARAAHLDGGALDTERHREPGGGRCRTIAGAGEAAERQYVVRTHSVAVIVDRDVDHRVVLGDRIRLVATGRAELAIAHVLAICCRPAPQSAIPPVVRPAH